MNLMTLANSPDGAVVRGTRGPALFKGRGEGLVVGVRPEAMHLTTAHGLEAEVVAAEYLGADTVLTCKLGQETLALRAPGQLPHGAGTAVRIAADPAALHLFDARTGARLGGTALATH
jgi:sn-glycerol 3-phosphate transport system ATP-binding protein